MDYLPLSHPQGGGIKIPKSRGGWWEGVGAHESADGGMGGEKRALPANHSTNPRRKD
jgi:hypothetical protein